MEGLPVRRPPDGRLPEHRRRHVDVLSGREADLRSGVAPASDDPPDRQDAVDCRLRLPSPDGPLLRLPGQRTELHRQLPEHAVQDDRAEVQGEQGPRARARRVVHPARRSRAELQHQRDAGHRLVARRPVFGARGRGGGALRPAARRRQRSRAEDAEGDRLGRQRAGVHQARQGRRRPADGIRPPRLQVCTTRGPRSSSRRRTWCSR